MMLIGAHYLWHGSQLQRNMGVTVNEGRVRYVAPLNGAEPDLEAHVLMPTCTDLQVNGGGGTMINSDPSADGMRCVAEAHAALGTGTILPTVITDRREVIEMAADAIQHLSDDPRIGGIHFEGPHINPDRRGTHALEHIRPLDLPTVEMIETLRKGHVPVMITLAPETSAPDLVARLVASGAVVSAGHSAATADETRRALDLGVSCFTHLYNAMPPMTSRAPGILGTALNAETHAGIIVDGIHVDWDMVRLALRARPRPGLTFAVSDAMATVGGPDHFFLYGQTISVRDGALINGEGSLAGAHITLVESLANLVAHVGLPLDAAIPMVTDIPRRVMGLAAREIAPGCPATEILLLSEQLTRMDPPECFT